MAKKNQNRNGFGSGRLEGKVAIVTGAKIAHEAEGSASAEAFARWVAQQGDSSGETETLEKAERTWAGEVKLCKAEMPKAEMAERGKRPSSNAQRPMFYA